MNPSPFEITKSASLTAFAFWSLGLTALKADGDRQSKPTDDRVFWQAHRGGGAHEAPDNTMGAFTSTWDLGGIPEADLRTSKDGVILCLHDRTLARTTDAPDNIRKRDVKELAFDEVRKWNTGVKFSDEFGRQKIPSLEEVFAEMEDHPKRQIYLDLKDVDLEKLGELIDRFSINTQVLIASPNRKDCLAIKEVTKGIRTMLWIGGSAGEIRRKFKDAVDSGFAGLDQVQLHLRDAGDKNLFRYQLNADYLRDALQVCSDSKVDLEVFPFAFDETSIHGLLDIGIRWYATDEPKRFSAAVLTWR